MAQTTVIVDALKKALKANRKTYADVARVLDLTEASVKRLFSEKDFSLRRLDQICQLIGMEISDVLVLLDDKNRYISQLTEQAEKELVADVKLLLVGVCVLNNWRFSEIISIYDLSEIETIRLLAKLDKLKMIELLPNNRIKLLIAHDFSWREGGAIEAFFEANACPEFLGAKFNQKGEARLFKIGMLSQGSAANILKKMLRLVNEFEQLHREDASLALHERMGTGLLLAIRPAWELAAFQMLRRNRRAASK